MPLQIAKEQLFGPFHPLYTAKPTLGTLLVPLVGQSQKVCSQKVISTVLHRKTGAEPVRPLYPGHVEMV